MRYSYCWPLAASDYDAVISDALLIARKAEAGEGSLFQKAARAAAASPLYGRYVVVEGRADPIFPKSDMELAGDTATGGHYVVAWADGGAVPIVVSDTARVPAHQEEVVLSGRVVLDPAWGSMSDMPMHLFFVDSTASRFHPASISGLVVGAMGVLVFAVYLRHWLKERRAFGEQART